MRKNLWKFTALFLTLGMSLTSSAHLRRELDKAFAQLSTGTTTTTDAQAYQGQRAGYYTGGSLSNRAPVKNYRLATIRFPKISAGCGGIDIFTGGLSFINSEELKDALKNIGNNAVTYAFMLGLETISPTIKNTIDSLSAKADAINRMNINSCEMGAALVGSVWPKTDAASEKVCETLAMSNNAVSDRVKARHHCGTPSQREQTLSSGKHSSEMKEIVFENTNIVWELVKQQLNLPAERELGELLQSLSGTLVVKAGHDATTPAIFPSLVSDTLIDTLLKGGEVQLYRCDEVNDCLNPELEVRTISTADALTTKVTHLLESMQAKIKVDQPLSEDEKNLLSHTRLPVYKILNVQSAFEGGESLIGLGQYADLIALDQLYFYLDAHMESLNSHSATLTKYPPHLLTTYQEMLTRAISSLRVMQQRLLQKEHANTQLIERTMELEKSLMGRLSANLTAQANHSASHRNGGL